MISWILILLWIFEIIYLDAAETVNAPKKRPELNVQNFDESIIPSSQTALTTQLTSNNSPDTSFISSTQKPVEFDSSQSIQFFVVV
jgi:hypothetical protein